MSRPAGHRYESAEFLAARIVAARDFRGVDDDVRSAGAIVLIWIVGLLFLWATGQLLTTALRVRVADALVRLAVQCALGLSLWPILFLATSTLGIVMSTSAMRVIVFATIIGGLAVRADRVRTMRWSRVRRSSPLFVTFAMLAVLAIVTRVSHIDGLAFPPWVDGVHHAMIVRLVLEHGAVPATADPYIAGAPFFYHWGFHVPAAFVAAAVNEREMPTLLLQYGQLLNALSLLMVYAAGRVLLRSRQTAMIAAALAMFVSYYPAFYLSWGRYTHLAGTLVLPPLLIALWRLAHAQRPARWLVVSVVLASGMLLIHVRIALFAFVVAIVMLTATRVKRTLLRWSCVAFLTALVCAPWLITLARNPHVGEVIATNNGRALPMHLIASTHNRELLALATAGISGVAGWLSMPIAGRALSAAWWIAIVLVARKRKLKTRRALQLIATSVAIIAVLLYAHPSGFATIDSAVITLFLPLSLAGAALIAWVLPRAWLMPLALVIAIGGAATMRHIVNPSTVFTDEHDLRAMRWIEANVPRDAVFAVDARPWMPPAYVGTDGGYWLHVTTGRHTILPPLLYAWSLPRARVDSINALLANWSSTNPDWRVLREAGVTHIYVGARGSAEKRRALLATNRVKLIHRDGDVLVFEIR